MLCQWSREFYDTGWNKVCFPNPCDAPSSSLSFEAVSTGDRWDRLVAVAVDGAELLRFITPFGGRISGEFKLPQELWDATRGREVCVLFTTFAAGGGGWKLTVDYTSPGDSRFPKVVKYPLWFVEWITSQKRTLRGRVGAHVDGFVLNMTGHRSEEGGGVNRTFVLRVDGREVWRQTFPDWRWRPGQGVVQPIYVSYKGYAGDVELTCENCGDIWVVSGWAYSLHSPTIPPTTSPVMLLAIAGATSAFASAYVVSK
jgi:hypothetical protein